MPPERTIPNEDVPAGYARDDDVATAFMDRWKDAKRPSGDSDEDEGEAPARDETDEQETEEAPAAEAEEGGEDPEKGSEDDDNDEPTVASDDAKVVVKVGDQEHQVSVADLKRLYGQEAALTQKSQKVAQLQSHFDQRVGLVQGKLDRLIQAAKERYDSLSGVNLAVLAKRSDVTEDDLRNLHREQQAAKADLDYLVGEHQEVAQAAQEETGRRHQEAVQQAVKALTTEDSPYFIPDIKTAYPKLLEYGVSHGVPAELMARETSPLVFKLMHKAMLYDKAQADAKKAKVTPKVKAGPKRVARPGGGGGDEGERPDLSKAKQELRNKGSADAAADLFLARWARN